MYAVAIIVWIMLVSCVSGADLYQPFYWSSYEKDGHKIEKAAILVPIVIEGCDKKLFAQLDTGADLSSFYGPALRKHGIAVDSVRHPDLNFKWCNFDGDYSTLGEHAYLRWDMGRGANPDSDMPSDHIVATIGLDQVVGKILILDFPGTRFAVLNDTSKVQSLVAGSIHYLNASVSNFKFYVDIVVGVDTLKGVRLDTGSSSSTLILPLKDWQLVTGLNGDEDVIVRDSVPSLGRFVHIWKAVAQDDLLLGSIRVATPEITYVDWPDPSLRSMSFLGNAPFVDSFVIVVDCIQERFGVSVPQ